MKFLWRCCKTNNNKTLLPGYYDLTRAHRSYIYLFIAAGTWPAKAGIMGSIPNDLILSNIWCWSFTCNQSWYTTQSTTTWCIVGLIDVITHLSLSAMLNEIGAIREMRTRKLDTKSTSMKSKKTYDLNIKWHCDHVQWQFTNRRMFSTRFLLTTLTTVHSYRFTWLSMYSWLSGPPHLMRLPILNHGRKAGPVNQRSRMSEFFTPSWRKTCKLEYMTGMLQNYQSFPYLHSKIANGIPIYRGQNSQNRLIPLLPAGLEKEDCPNNADFLSIHNLYCSQHMTGCYS